MTAMLRQRTALALVLAIVLAGTAGCGTKASVTPPQEAHAAPRLTNVDTTNIRAAVDWLAAPDRLGRRAGTPAATATADWLTTRFSEFGLTPAYKDGYRQEFTFERTKAVWPASLSLSGIAQLRPYLYRNDFRIEPVGGAGSVEAPVVFAGYGLTGPGRNDYQSASVRGKVVMIIRDCPPGTAPELASVTARVAAAAERGAAGALLIDTGRNLDWIAGIHPAAKIPVLTVGQGVAADLFAGSGFEFGNVMQQVEQRPVIPETLNGKAALTVTHERETGLKAANVVGYLAGTDAAAGYFIVGAHFDHLGVDIDGATYPGAFDNASGVAVMLEVARALALDRPGPGVLFVAWDAEEDGLYGSNVMAGALPLPARDLIGVINIDTLGGAASDWQVRHNAAAADLATRLAGEASSLGVATTTNTNTGGSDEQSFVRRDLPALRLTDATAPTKMHATTESPLDVSAARLALAAQAIIGTIDEWEAPDGSVTTNQPNGSASSGTGTSATGAKTGGATTGAPAVWRPPLTSVGTDGRVLLTTPDFAFRFKPGIKVAGDPAADAESFYELFTTRLGSEPTTPITVILTGNRAEQVATVRSVYREAAEPVTDAWVHYPSRTVVVRTGGTRAEMSLAIAHETAHLFVAAAMPQVTNSPWVGEYLVTYLERRVAGGALGLSEWTTKDDYAQRLSLVRAQPWTAIAAGATSDATIEAGSVYFFLEEKYGAERLTQLWQRLLNGSALEKALQTVYRKSATTLEGEWRTHFGLK